MAKPASGNENGVYRKTTLKDGLRVVTEQLPSVRSISIGVWVDVGSRNERPEDSGLCHFLEHMVFKKTRKRSARQIAASLESIGGSLNGFTSREQTCFTARILDEHLAEAIDVLADLTCNASITAADMDKERLVICEEIKESLDTPSDHIHDLFARSFWGEHPLGQPIMGSLENVMNMTRSRMKAFRKRNYRAGSVLVAASGAVSHNRLVRLVRQNFTFPEGCHETPEGYWRSRDKAVSVTDNDSKQTHLCLGFPGFSYGAKEKLSALALSAYLGGGMSSVLFQRIREERGLAYSVYTYNDLYRDSGVFGAYLGTDSERLAQAFEVVLRELKRIKKKRLTTSTLAKVKAQIKGHLTLSLESTSARMSRLARQELVGSGYRPLKQLLREIDRVSSSDILDAANRILDENRMAVAVLGPADENVFTQVA
ncbi:MAG TPA: pitrilysin family protein [Acidobacteriota bacterium]|nr:pitrilysin family protein [Acidobacteriota bacterium]